jgi:transcription initiation factor TFIIIB Brf1 subunit/transcription initiation factor TFIIB
VNACNIEILKTKYWTKRGLKLNMTYVKSITNWKPIIEGIESSEICCANQNLIERDGFNVCSNCGTTISPIVREIPNGNYSIYEKNTKRQNEKVLTPIGPRTVFKSYKDGKGNDLSPGSYNKFHRLAKINRGLRTSLERNLWIALPKFKILAGKLNLPSYATEEAYKIYTLSVKKKLTLGRGIDNILAASFYTAIRIYKVARSVEEICDAAQITSKDLMKNFKAIHDEILPLIDVKPKIITSNRFLIRYYKELDLPMECQKIALDLIDCCKKKGMRTSGKDPKGIAAAALYISAQKVNQPRIQKDVCKVTGISEVTLRSRIKDLKSFA